MRIAMREHHHVSHCELDRWFTRDARPAAAVRDHMVGNQMLRAGKHSADDRCACRRFCYPRLRRLNILTGIHFRLGVEKGTEHGRKIAQRAANVFLRPVQ
jgi:hypothetical protein